MDIADPDELVTFAVDPAGGAQLVLHGLQEPGGDRRSSHQAQRETNPAKRRAALREDPDIAAHDAFLGFLYYSPFRYAYSDKVHGFFV